MSDPRSIGAAAPGPWPAPQVHAAIARAAQATGVDFAYLLGEARLESRLNPDARAATSSAAGLYQFTSSTWLQTLDRHGAEHGLGWAGAAIAGGRITDPAQRSAIMDLRYDPGAAALMAGELANDNRQALTGVLGREPDAGELYLAHFLGAGGASQFLSALAADPGQSAAGLFPAAAAANRAIFYDAAGAPRSLGGLMDLMRGKMASAMGDAGIPDALLPSPSGKGWGTNAAWGNDAASGFSAGVEPPSGRFPNGEGLSGQKRPSMADTLSATFGGSAEAMPPHVRAAYGKLLAFGL